MPSPFSALILATDDGLQIQLENSGKKSSFAFRHSRLHNENSSHFTDPISPHGTLEKPGNGFQSTHGSEYTHPERAKTVPALIHEIDVLISSDTKKS